MFLIIVVLQISVTCLAQEQLPFPLTTHTVEATSADFPANMPDEAKKRMIGKWELTFTKEGRFNLTKEKTVYVDSNSRSDNKACRLR